MSRRPDQATIRTASRRAMLSLLTLLICVAGQGCLRPGKRAYHEALMDEKRVLEDQLYDLAYEYEILEQKLRAMEAGHGAIELDLDMGSGMEEVPSGDPNPVPDPEFQGSGGSDGAPQMEIEIDPPSGQPNELPAPGDNDLRPDADPSAPSTVPDLTPPNLGNGSQGASVPRAPMGARGPTVRGTGHVEEIRLNPVYTGGENFDQMPGDDGIVVLIEPRGSRGEVLAQPGKVSVVVVDPAIPNDRARVARWDLSEQEVADHVQREAGRRGIQLKLPWTQSRPENSKLHLFVRYETPDGRELESDREFYVNVDGAVATGWTPRSRSDRSNRTARRNSSNASRNQLQREPAPASAPQRTEEPIRQVSRPQWRPVR